MHPFISLIISISLHPVKTIAAGEAGVVVTNNKALAQKSIIFRNHGINKEQATFKNTSLAFQSKDIPNPWYYEMNTPSLNFRASDIHCALGVSQLKKINRFIEKRRRLVDIYKSFIKKHEPDIRFLKNVNNCNSCWHLFVVLIDFPNLGIERGTVIKNLLDQGIHSQVHYIPLHFQPYYKRVNPELRLLGAEKFYSSTLSLPLFFGMEDDDVARVCDNLFRILGIIS